MCAKKRIANEFETRDESGSKAVTLRLLVLNTNLEAGEFAYHSIPLLTPLVHGWLSWKIIVSERLILNLGRSMSNSVDFSARSE